MLVRHVEPSTDQFEQRIRADIGFLVGKHQHLDAGSDQEHREHIQHPREFRDNRCTKPDHYRAKHDHTQNTPEQHAVLIPRRHRKKAENHGNDEHIVDRQRLLDGKPGEIGQPQFGTQFPPHPDAELKTKGDVAGRQHKAFTHTDRPVRTMQHAKVEREQHNNDTHERQPHPDRLSEPQNIEKIR